MSARRVGSSGWGRATETMPSSEPVQAQAATCTPERFPELEATVERGLEAYIQTGQALAEIRDTRAYLLAGYSSFNTYLEGRWSWSRRTAFNLLAAWEVTHELVQTSAPVALPTRSQAVELARLDPPVRHDLLQSLDRPL